MISQLEKEVTLRYLKTRKKDGFLNVISIFSFIGISLGVAVLIIVMSVMNGFRTELVEKIVGFNPHSVIKPYDNAIDENLFNNKELNILSKVFVYSNSGESVLINKDYTKGLLLRGYLPEDFKKLSIVKKANFSGNKKLNPNYISIGKELSFNYDIKIGDKILIMSPAGVQTIVGNLPKQKTYIVDSIFDSEIADFDQNVAFINLNDLENLFDLKTSNRNLEIYLKNPKNIDVIKQYNGTIYKGKIIEQNIKDGEGWVKIEIAGGSVIHITKDKIESEEIKIEKRTTGWEGWLSEWKPDFWFYATVITVVAILTPKKE